MQDKLEKLIAIIYKKWKSHQAKIQEPHPDEETLACFIEGKLSPQENQRIKNHLIKCDCCQEALAVQARIDTLQERQLPKELLERVKNLVIQQDKPSVLEILLKAKEHFLEIINTTGDVLVGQELVPARILPRRQIKDFKDEVTILKDFKDMRVEVKIENKAGQFFNLTVAAKEKWTNKIIKDLRVTVLKDDLELESYLTDAGAVTFEHVSLGKYTVEISNLEQKLASVLLEIKT